MASLAEDSLSGTASAGRRVGQVAIVLLGAVAVGALGFGLKSLISTPNAPKRQVARIAILPDTPPPPPPPPKEDKRPEPPKQEAPRPQPKPDEPKPVEAPKPANEALKMEGAAGDGPSAFAAGSVSKEYSGGAPAIGGVAAAAASAPSAVDRAQERFYASSARQLLQGAIERHLKSEAGQATATFAVWVERDGAIRRFELEGSGDSRLDGELNAAFEDTQRNLRLPPPPAIAQPMKFRITLRPQG